MNICLFTKEEINQPLSVRDPRGQHIIKILHKKEGENFTAGIIGGASGKAVIRKIEEQTGTTSDGKKTFDDSLIYFEFIPEEEKRKLNNLAMIIGFPRPIQLKRLLRDMAALGVCQVHLTGTELTEKSYLKSDMANPDSVYQLLLEGTVQAGSTFVPEVHIHNSLKECLDFIEENYIPQNKYALDNIEPEEGLPVNLNRTPAVKAVAAIGSERGWTGKERDLLKEKGYTLLGMGERIMRTETAATVAASLILSSMKVFD